MNDKIPVLVITGATATGKSAVALECASRLGGEIISGDSMQVYRGMDVGTAKPSEAERSAVRHHLIDIADIGESFSAAVFIEKAARAVSEIRSRGKLPVLAGGTGLYIDLFLSGRFFDGAGGDAEYRSALYSIAEKQGAEALHGMLEKADPASAAEIHPNNIKRVVRALEILRGTGETKSLRAETNKKNQSPYDAEIIYLACGSREELYRRINARVDQMLGNGLEREARLLFEKGLENAPTASQAIGYKEFFPYFKGVSDIGTVVSQIKQNTRNYAKRQITYFNRIPDKNIFDISVCGKREIIASVIKKRGCMN